MKTDMINFDVLTSQQLDFLQLYVINDEPIGIEAAAKELQIDRKELSKWYDEPDFKQIRQEISKIKSLWKRKSCTINFLDFYKWYKAQERKCDYCEITEEQIASLIAAGKLKTKRLVTRGRTLELDRKDSEDLTYNNLDNLALCCYWCNNAKTDTFTHEEFKIVGKTFRKIWNERLLS